MWSLCVPLVALYLLAGNLLLRAFMDHPSQGALDSGIAFLWVVAPFYFVVSTKLVADGILRGAGLMRQFVIATFTDLILRVVLAFILSATALGSTGIWCAWPIGWGVAAALSVLFYRASAPGNLPQAFLRHSRPAVLYCGAAFFISGSSEFPAAAAERLPSQVIDRLKLFRVLLCPTDLNGLRGP